MSWVRNTTCTTLETSVWYFLKLQRPVARTQISEIDYTSSRIICCAQNLFNPSVGTPFVYRTAFSKDPNFRIFKRSYRSDTFRSKTVKCRLLLNDVLSRISMAVVSLFLRTETEDLPSIIPLNPDGLCSCLPLWCSRYIWPRYLYQTSSQPTLRSE